MLSGLFEGTGTILLMELIARVSKTCEMSLLFQVKLWGFHSSEIELGSLSTVAGSLRWL